VIILTLELLILNPSDMEQRNLGIYSNISGDFQSYFRHEIPVLLLNHNKQARDVEQTKYRLTKSENICQQQSISSKFSGCLNLRLMKNLRPT
jgi:hypothetical protein